MIAGLRGAAAKKPGRFLLAMAGFVLPLVLLLWAFSTHNAVDNIMDYLPTRMEFLAVGAASLLVLLAALADLTIGKSDEFPSPLTSLLSAAGVLMVLAIASFLLVPQIFRSGDAPPQLIMTESGSGMPGLAVVFYTEQPTSNTLEYRAIGGQSQVLGEGAAKQHWFQLPGLEPNKSYEYSINGGQPVRFRTPPASHFTFAVSGDPHFGAEASRNDLTLKMAEKMKEADMLFFLGDTVQLGFSDALWKKAFASLSKATSSVPSEYVIGNHDAMFGGAELYKEYLCPPGLEDASRNCLTKRIDNGNAHILVLDVEWELESYTTEEKEWLEAQLASIPRDDWCIVMSHTFYYSSGSYKDGWAWYDNNATIAELTPLFEKYGVDMVFSGHKHDTELLEKNNVTYVVVGSFGGPPDDERSYVSPASVWYRQGAYDFAEVTIENRTTATIRFIDSNQTEVFRKEVSNR